MYAVFKVRFRLTHLTSRLNSHKPMGLSGLEPPTSRLSGVRSNQLSYKPILKSFDFSGDEEIRTLDPLLARQVLSQLSYIPIWSGVHLLSHIVSNAVPSAACVLTVVFGMGTGVSHKRIDTRNMVYLIGSSVSSRQQNRALTKFVLPDSLSVRSALITQQ